MGVTCATQHWVEGGVGVSHPWVVARRPHSHFGNILPWPCQFFNFPHSGDERPVEKLQCTSNYLKAAIEFTALRSCATI